MDTDWELGQDSGVEALYITGHLVIQTEVAVIIQVQCGQAVWSKDGHLQGKAS